MRIRSAEKLAEIRKKTAPDQELLQCERCSKLCAPRAFLRQELAQMWREAGLPDSPPDAAQKEACEALLFELWRPGGFPHPAGALNLTSTDPDCLVWRARMAWLQNQWLQHVHYAGCFAKSDVCKSDFPVPPNDHSRALATVSGPNGRGAEVVTGLAIAESPVLDLTGCEDSSTARGAEVVTGLAIAESPVVGLTGCEDSSASTVRDAEAVTGLATEENRVLDLTVSCTVSDLGGGKRNAASQGAGKRGSKRHQTSARAAMLLAQERTQLLLPQTPSVLVAKASLAASSLAASMSMTRRKMMRRRRRRRRMRNSSCATHTTTRLGALAMASLMTQSSRQRPTAGLTVSARPLTLKRQGRLPNATKH